MASARELIGIILIFANVCINVASMELMQSMETHFDFDQPVFIIYVHHSIGTICLPVGLLLLRQQDVSLSEAIQEIGMTGRRFAFCIIALSALYKYNVLWTLAMPRVTVTLFNAISNSAFVFVLFFSMCLLDESITLGKVVSVLLTAAGVALVILYPSVKGQKTHHTTVAGLLLSFCCAMGQVPRPQLTNPSQPPPVDGLILLSPLVRLFTPWCTRFGLAAEGPGPSH